MTALFAGAVMFAQDGAQLITWKSHVEKADAEDVYRVIFTGKIAEGYHTYTLTDEFSATEFMDVAVNGGTVVGNPYEISVPVEEVDEFGEKAKHYYNEIILAQDIKLEGAKASMWKWILPWPFLLKTRLLPHRQRRVQSGDLSSRRSSGDLQCFLHHVYSQWFR